jgi:hypothetical protein
LAWPIEHLMEAADYWQAAGAPCYKVAQQVWQTSLSVDWQGKGNDKLHTGTYADMTTTASAVNDQLDKATKTARVGHRIRTRRARGCGKSDGVHAAGFGVNEDLSVTDRSSGGRPSSG